MQHDCFLISATALVLTLLYCLSAIWVMRKGSRPKLWLAIILTTVFVYVLFLAFMISRQPDFPEKLMFSYSLTGIFIVGLLLGYCRSLMFPWKNNRALLVRLLSVIAAYVVMYIGLSVFYRPAPALHSFRLIAEYIGHPVVILRIAVFSTLVVFMVCTCIQMALMYRRHQTCIAEQFSFREDINLSQLLYLVGFFMLYGMVGIAHILLIDLRWIYITANFIYAGFYLCISIMGLRQQDIYTRVEIDLNKIESQSVTSIISVDLRNRLIQELELMLQNYAYRNPELRINDVTQTLRTNRTYLSAIIRENFNDNFIGLVNRYRIEEAKELLSSNNSLSILEISEQVGFKSITSFNLFFKKETGLNPTQFRKI